MILHSQKKRERTNHLSRILFYFRNTPHINENIFIITAAYAISGVNCIVLRLFSSGLSLEGKRALTVMGIILIAVALLSIVERRPQMTGTVYTLICVVIHLIICLVFAVLFSWIWIVIYLIETSLICGYTVYSVYKKTK